MRMQKPGSMAALLTHVPLKPPICKELLTTRWHGTSGAKGFRLKAYKCMTLSDSTIELQSKALSSRSSTVMRVCALHMSLHLCTAAEHMLQTASPDQQP